MDAEDVRRWVEARRVVEEIERQAAGTAPAPRRAWQQALPLFALVGRLVGWPVPPDAVRSREDAAALEAWRRVRAGGRWT